MHDMNDSLTKEAYYKLLVCPESGHILESGGDENSLVCKTCGTSYAVEQGIPILLCKNNSGDMKHTKLHDSLGTQFDYKEHYQLDSELYDYYRPFRSAALNHETGRLHEIILHTIAKTCSVVLDVGCGNAWLAGDLIKKGMHVISMDISLKNPLRAQENYPGSNHFGLVADVYNLPLNENSVDCIVASEIMEHVVDPELFISKLYRAMKPGGKLIVTTPYNEQIEYFLCIHCNKPSPKSAHLHSFNSNNIQSLIPMGCHWKWKCFSNMYLIKLKSHLLLKYLNTTSWIFIDRIFNAIFNNPSRLLIEIVKPL
jgi:SAM-dependent methyltransferase/uncharacterized protein YbaR (Trm112 family)